MNFTNGEKPLAFHFCNSSRDNFLFYAHDILSYGGIICLDFEDIVPHSLDNKKYSHLKSINRKEVTGLIERIISIVAPAGIGIRLNTLDSIELQKDISAIKTIRFDSTTLHFFLPKIKSKTDIFNYSTILKETRIKNFDLIPIIETCEAFSDLEELISYPEYLICRIAFGHCDFNYARGNFPFIHQADEEYWKWINEIALKIKPEIIFLNSPFLFLKDSDNFHRMLNRLHSIFGLKFSQITLTLSQLKDFHDYPAENKKFRSIGVHPKTSKKEYAEWIVSSYENNRIENRSFSLTNERLLISPQEYSAAVEYLLKLK